MARQFLTIDCETDPFAPDRVPKPFLWGVYDGETFSTYLTFQDIYEKYKTQDVVFYAHNGGKFDFHFLLDFINPYEPIMVINGRLAKVKIGNCEFRDSYCLFPMPLSAYQKDELNYGILEKGERDKPHNRDLIYKYLRGDCVYLYDLIKTFIESYGTSLTLASSAFKQWRLITGAKTPHTTKDFYGQIKPFYYGGRVEAFRLGEIKEPFSVYDINSAYPNAMLRDHPYGTSFAVSDHLPSKDVELAFIELECAGRGQFPFRTRDGLYFPNDGIIRQFSITGYEFVRAVSIGLLEKFKLIRVFTFPERINFKSYVNYFFRLKQEAEEKGDKIKRLMAKLFLNGLYGKFAANPENYREYQCLKPEFIEASQKEGWEFNSHFGKWALMYRAIALNKQNYYNVATGASITGFQRAEMMEAIQNVKKPFYCDTDSIICASCGSLRIGKGLGDWKKENDCIYGAIAGKKLYAFRKKEGDYKFASKGVHLTPKQIIKIAKGAEIESKNITPTFSINKEPYFISRKIKMKKELQFIN